MFSLDIWVVFLEIHTLCKRCGPLLQNHEGFHFSLFSGFPLNNLSGRVHILINDDVFSAVCWHVISCFGKLGSLSSGPSCEWSFCSFVSGVQFGDLGVIGVCSKAASSAVGLAVFCGV